MGRDALTPKDIEECYESLNWLKDFQTIIFGNKFDFGSKSLELSLPFGGNNKRIVRKEDAALIYEVLYNFHVVRLLRNNIDLAGGL